MESLDILRKWAVMDQARRCSGLVNGLHLGIQENWMDFGLAEEPEGIKSSYPRFKFPSKCPFL